MKAVEFTSKLKNNLIHIPKKIQNEIRNAEEKNVRVMIFWEEENDNIHNALNHTITEQFLKGYADSDSIYDNF